MTLIVGIKCSDGVVVGADGAATLGNPFGLSTVMQPVAKLSIVQGRAIVGVSGPVGTSQLFTDRVDQIYQGLSEIAGIEACRQLRIAFLQDAEITLKVAGFAQAVVGSVAQQDVVCQTVVAMAPQGVPNLIQFDYQCAPEMATDDLPFVAIGSGQSIADPFLAFLRRIFWEHTLPSMPEGIFATLWTLRHAIQTAPGGIADPITITTLQINGDGPVARQLSKPELQDHEEAITDAERHLKEFRTAQQPGYTEDQPPQPPGV